MPRSDARLFHRADADCPPGAQLMMSETHRIGCANGVHCRTSAVPHLSARAEYYARFHEDGGHLVTRYFCPACAAPFAHRFGLPVPEAPRGR